MKLLVIISIIFQLVSVPMAIICLWGVDYSIQPLTQQTSRTNLNNMYFRSSCTQEICSITLPVYTFDQLVNETFDAVVAYNSYSDRLFLLSLFRCVRVCTAN